MGFFDAIGNIFGTKMTNDANAKEAGKSREFTKEQLQNQHQWEVADLRKAGLNPMLSANKGAGVGSSAQAVMQAPNVDGLDEKNLMSSAMAWKNLNAQLDNLRADTDQKKSTTQSNSENLQTQNSTQLANQSSAKAQQSLARLYEEQRRGVALENDKQQVVKAGYDAAAPFVERAVQTLQNSAKAAADKKHTFKKYQQNPVHTGAVKTLLKHKMKRNN